MITAIIYLLIAGGLCVYAGWLLRARAEDRRQARRDRLRDSILTRI